MGKLHITEIEDDLIARLEERAARHGRTPEAEHLHILRQVLAADAGEPFERLAADLRRRTSRRRQTPSEILVREGRAER